MKVGDLVRLKNKPDAEPDLVVELILMETRSTPRLSFWRVVRANGTLGDIVDMVSESLYDIIS